MNPERELREALDYVEEHEEYMSMAAQHRDLYDIALSLYFCAMLIHLYTNDDAAKTFGIYMAVLGMVTTMGYIYSIWKFAVKTIQSYKLPKRSK